MPNLRLQKNPSPVPSKEPMEWLASKLNLTRTLRPWMPDGYESYVRVLHPGFAVVPGTENGTPEVLVPWSTVCEWSGKPLNATSHIGDVMRREDGINWAEPGREGVAPPQGQMDSASLSRLLIHLTEETSTPDEIWMLIWTGYAGQPDTVGLPVEVSWFLRATGREYVLLRGSISSSPDSPQVMAFENPPTFWWPADRSWFVVCDIDASSTYVGGTDKLIQRILNDIELESFPAQLDDPYEGYYVAPASTSAVNPRIGFTTRLRHHSLFFRFRFGRRRRGSAIYQMKKNKFWK